MSDISEVVRLIEDQGTQWQSEFRGLKSIVDELEKKAGRPKAEYQGDAPKSDDTWFDTKTGKAVKVLSHGQSLTEKNQAPALGRMLRGIVLGGRADDARELEQERKSLGISADPAGGYTVAGALSNEWVDLLRAQMVLSRAGARTVPMSTSELSLAKVTADPTVTWHGENADITATEPSFGAVKLTAKTAVTVVKLSLELSQDSSNIQDILERTLIGAMAAAIDSAGINGVTTNAAAAPSGLVNLAGRNTVLSVGTPTAWDFALDALYTLLAANVPMENISAMIANPDLWKKMAKLKTGIASDNTTLAMPPEVAALPKLWSTAAPSGKAIFGDFRDLLFGVRQDIQVKVLSETFMGGNLQVAILCYARCDFAATRAASFTTAEGITGL